MPIYSADIPPLHPVSFLWALPAAPAAGAVVLAVAGRFLERRFGRAAVGGVAVVAAGAAAGIALAAVFGVLLAAPPGARVLLDARGALLDVSGVQVPAALLLDPLSAALALAVALVGAGVAVSLAASPRLAPDFVGAARALGATLAGALLLVLADNHLLALVGWEVLVLAGLVLVAPPLRDPKDAEAPKRVALGLAVSRVGQTAWLASVVVLLGGLAAADVAGEHAVLADVPGAGGAGIELRTKGDRSPTASLGLVVVGPTLVHREIAQQLALRDTSERRPFEEALLARRFGRMPLLPVVCFGLLLGVACLALSFLMARPMPGPAGGARVPTSTQALVATAVVASTIGLFLRAWPLYALSPGAAAAAVALCVGGLGAAAGSALTGRAIVTPIVRVLVREIGVLPIADGARAAGWLDRRLLAPLARLLVIAAAVSATILLLLVFLRR